jgi:hypothetical protein
MALSARQAILGPPLSGFHCAGTPEVSVHQRFFTSYLFLPLVWPHGPIGHLGGPAPGVPRQWPILGAGPPKTA